MVNESFIYILEYELNIYIKLFLSIIAYNIIIYLFLINNNNFTYNQIIEFSNHKLYNSDNIHNLEYINLIILHLIHYIIGHYSSYNYSNILFLFNKILIIAFCYFGNSVLLLPQLTHFTLQLSYWHFVELLWLIIDFLLYTLVLFMKSLNTRQVLK